MMRLTRSALALLLASSLAACSSEDDPTRPVQLFGTTFGASELVELDPATGALLRTIGPVGYRVNGLEYDHVTGKLFATTSNGDANFPNGLIEIDLDTGAGTPIGTGAGMTIMNPTVNSAGEMYAWTEDFDDLVTVDTTTGLATVVGDSELSSFEHGLAFDLADRLVFVNGDGRFYAMDTATGAATFLAFADVRAHHGDFHPVTGHYWGIDETNDTGPDAQRSFRIIDVDARTMSFGTQTVDNLFAITFK
jgi:hypothetical protein